MKDRIKANTESLNSLVFKWALPQDKSVNYVEDIVKETGLLHKIMVSILPKEEVNLLFHAIYNCYNNHLSNLYDSIKLPSKNTKAKIYSDIVSLLNGLNKIHPGMGNSLESYFKERFGN